VPTTILTSLDARETAQAIEDMAALPLALDGARLVGSIGPRARNQRTGPNAVGTFRYLLADGSQTMVTHDGDNHLRFVHEEADGPTRRIELDEVLLHRTSRASLGKDAQQACASVRALVEDLDPTHDPVTMNRLRGASTRLQVLLRIAMVETIGRRTTDALGLPVAGRQPTLSIWDGRSRSTWKLSTTGARMILDLAGSTCLLTRKTAGMRDWKFERRSVPVASNAEMDALDAMERMRLMLEAQDLVASKPFRQVRIGEEYEELRLSAN